MLRLPCGEGKSDEVYFLGVRIIQVGRLVFFYTWSLSMKIVAGSLLGAIQVVASCHKKFYCK